MKEPAKKGSKLYSIIHLKCPRCMRGNLFAVRNPFNLKRMLEMPGECPVCQQDFKIEPGFYSGALWVSYPIVLLIIVPLSMILLFYFDLSFLLSFSIPFVLLVLLQPWIMRVSRAIWINFFVDFAPLPAEDLIVKGEKE